MKDVHALTMPHDKIVNSIKTSVEIVNPFTKEKATTRGLWDTGATHSAITKSVAEKLGLVEIQRISVSGVHGIKEVPVYYVEILLNKGKVSLASLVSECTELSADGSVGALIGMNVINQGDFAITNFQEKTTMSFRIPSKQKIDFVEGLKTSQPIVQSKLPSRNDMCPCGSGKKYKHCCDKK
jgi:predicted aspartyl protease